MNHIPNFQHFLYLKADFFFIFNMNSEWTNKLYNETMKKNIQKKLKAMENISSHFYKNSELFSSPGKVFLSLSDFIHYIVRSFSIRIIFYRLPESFSQQPFNYMFWPNFYSNLKEFEIRIGNAYEFRVEARTLSLFPLHAPNKKSLTKTKTEDECDLLF